MNGPFPLLYPRLDFARGYFCSQASAFRNIGQQRLNMLHILGIALDQTLMIRTWLEMILGLLVLRNFRERKRANQTKLFFLSFVNTNSAHD